METLQVFKQAILQADTRVLAKMINYDYVQPDIDCLNIAISQQNLKLVAILLGFPYFLQPTEESLICAILQDYTPLALFMLEDRYSLTPSRLSLQAAILKRNVEIVKALLDAKYNIQINSELVLQIDDPHYDNPQAKEIRLLLTSRLEEQWIKPLPIDFLVD